VDEQQPKDTTARTPYETPRVEKLVRLSRVTEGEIIIVTDGAEPKGGCFEPEE
jgi:hypothetical protein